MLANWLVSGDPYLSSDSSKGVNLQPGVGRKPDLPTRPTTIVDIGYSSISLEIEGGIYVIAVW